MKTVKVIVRETGKGRPVDQYPGFLNGYSSRWAEGDKTYEERVPLSVCIDPRGQPLQTGNYECVKVWVYTLNDQLRGATFDEYNTFSTFENWAKNKLHLNPSIAYQSVEPEKKIKKPYGINTNYPINNNSFEFKSVENLNNNKNQSIEAAVKGEKEPTIAELTEIANKYNFVAKRDEYKGEGHTLIVDRVRGYANMHFDGSNKDYLPEQSTPVNEAKEVESVEMAALYAIMNATAENPDFDMTMHRYFVSGAKFGYNYRDTYPIENKEGVKSVDDKVYQVRFRHKSNYGQYKPWVNISRDEYEQRLKVINNGYDLFEVRELEAAQFTPIEQGKRMVNEWISVEDRLPEKDGRYLAYVKASSGLYDKGVHILIFDTHNLFGRATHKHVTHWAYRPEGPVTQPNQKY